jgi:hypothetical protein
VRRQVEHDCPEKPTNSALAVYVPRKAMPDERDSSVLQESDLRELHGETDYILLQHGLFQSRVLENFHFAVIFLK